MQLAQHSVKNKMPANPALAITSTPAGNIPASPRDGKTQPKPGLYLDGSKI